MEHCEECSRDLSVTWFGDKALIKSRKRQGAEEGREGFPMNAWTESSRY